MLFSQISVSVLWSIVEENPSVCKLAFTIWEHTLRLTHLAGKQAVNIFTAIHAMTGQEEISHPAVGFKSHLIRLIGNLCYKNKENQDKVCFRQITLNPLSLEFLYGK
ncbi:hypothetical protein llap_22252 [Limosa lapponica baueri]|uniref:Uncharacterized protein n=1 Tax=Limosa lapponica baueri TaxID=1758121 RepID=A0A2I0T0Z6_LIMLA|nr:hypothetical protein llap_22252 [Limosa lapponica baueri]